MKISQLLRLILSGAAKWEQDGDGSERDCEASASGAEPCALLAPAGVRTRSCRARSSRRLSSSHKQIKCNDSLNAAHRAPRLAAPRPQQLAHRPHRRPSVRSSASGRLSAVRERIARLMGASLCVALWARIVGSHCGSHCALWARIVGSHCGSQWLAAPAQWPLRHERLSNRESRRHNGAECDTIATWGRLTVWPAEGAGAAAAGARKQVEFVTLGLISLRSPLTWCDMCARCVCLRVGRRSWLDGGAGA